MKRKSDNRDLDSGMLVFGVLLGLLIGGAVALFITPQSGKAFRRRLTTSVEETGQTLRAGVESAIADPVAESMAQGKAAAARRMAELSEP